MRPPLGLQHEADRIPRESGLRDVVADRDSVSRMVYGLMLIVFALMPSLLARCAEALLANVCPHSGGGFVPRQVRPAHEWREGAYLGARPASSVVRHRPADLQRHAQLVAAQGGLPPEQR